MSTRFDRTNFVAGIETLFNFVTYILRNNSKNETFGNEVISEVCIFYQYVLYVCVLFNIMYNLLHFQ
jgi:hypothetical protein